ncbi:MAG: hypothetical protein GF397_06725 [Elusimicrobia bacterium]|nr:hypothetical protein [Elusimicrobiota bacterium]
MLFFQLFDQHHRPHNFRYMGFDEPRLRMEIGHAFVPVFCFATTKQLMKLMGMSLAGVVGNSSAKSFADMKAFNILRGKMENTLFPGLQTYLTDSSDKGRRAGLLALDWTVGKHIVYDLGNRVGWTELVESAQIEVLKERRA